MILKNYDCGTTWDARGTKKAPKPRRCKPVGLWDMWDAAHTCIYGNIFSILFAPPKISSRA